MIKYLTLLLTLAASAVMAQNAFRLDLSGEWRLIVGEDRPEFAGAGFDDSAWLKVNMPLGDLQTIPNYSRGWLRRRVQLPSGAAEQPLALTFGTIRGIQEVFVNGQRIGASSESVADAQLPQPRSYRIPASAMVPGEMQIAIRVQTPLATMSHWRIADRGPWLLTDLAGTPWDAGKQYLEGNSAASALNLMLAPISFVIAVLSLWVWWSGRGRKELIWFALGSVMFTFLEAYGWLMLTPGARPFNADGYPIGLLLGELMKPLMAEFVFAAIGYRSRWLRLALWLGWLFLPIAFLLGRSNTSVTLFASAWCGVLSLSAIAFKVWQTRRQTSSLETKIFRIVLLAQPLVYSEFAVSRFLGLRSLVPGFESNGIQIGPYGFGTPPLSTVFLSAAMFILQLRRSRADEVERQRLTTEMEGARTLQQLLLPATATGTPRFELAATYEPAREVGGDFYWTRAEPDDSLIVVVGDVSGKGLKAAMLVSVAIGILRNEKSTSPASILGALNEGLTGHTGGGFVTCCCARFDADGTVTIANAGHPSPYCDDREVEVEAGLPLGIVADVVYDESVVKGSRFTFVSDGVVEAENAQRELFGFERTREISGKSAQEMVDAAKVWGQTDDITVVTVRRNAGSVSQRKEE